MLRLFFCRTSLRLRFGRIQYVKSLSQHLILFSRVVAYGEHHPLALRDAVKELWRQYSTDNQLVLSGYETQSRTKDDDIYSAANLHLVSACCTEAIPDVPKHAGNFEHSLFI